jgi:hypothetical protein
VDGLLYVADLSGYLHCFDAASGHKYWQHDLGAAVEASSQLVADGKVYVTSSMDELWVFQTGNEPQLLSRCDLDGSSPAPTAIDGVLFVATTRSVAAYKGDTYAAPGSAHRPSH